MAIRAKQHAFFNFFHDEFPFSISDIAYNEIFFIGIGVMKL